MHLVWNAPKSEIFLSVEIMLWTVNSKPKFMQQVMLKMQNLYKYYIKLLSDYVHKGGIKQMNPIFRLGFQPHDTTYYIFANIPNRNLKL